MRIISHRGLLDGPDSELENRPAQIMSALDEGFDAEVDLWVVDGKLYLGHDGPSHPIAPAFILDSRLWIHCKNMESFHFLRDYGHGCNFFYHDSDLVVLTSKQIGWTYLGKPETTHPRSICVMPEVTYGWDEIGAMARARSWYGMCSDYPRRIRACLA